MSEETRSKTFEVTLSGDALHWLEYQLETGQHASPEDMLRSLVLHEQAEIIAGLRATLDKGASAMTPAEAIEAIIKKRSDAAA